MAIFLDYPCNDELLVSVIGRYLDQYNVHCRVRYMQRLFGYFPSFTMHYMSNLDAIERETAQAWGWSSEKIARELTTFPYTEIFLSRDDANRLLNACRGDVFSTEIGRKLIRLLPAPMRVLVCYECFREDRVEGRQQYWRRSHQLPGVIFCWKHKTKLRMITVGHSSRRWPTPDSLHGLDQEIPIELSAEQRQRCIAIAELSNQLLTGSRRSIRDRLALYWTREVQETSYGRGACIVSSELADSLRAFFGEGYLRFVGFQDTPRFSHSRFTAFATGPGASALRFLLWHAFISDMGSRSNWVTWPMCPGLHQGTSGSAKNGLKFADFVNQSPCICGHCVTFVETASAHGLPLSDLGAAKPSDGMQASHQYDDSIKTEVIRRFQEPGATFAKLSREFGVNYATLRNWVRPRSRSKYRKAPGLLTSGEAARTLNVSIERLAKLADSGVFGEVARTPGGHQRFLKASVIEYRDILNRETG